LEAIDNRKVKLISWFVLLVDIEGLTIEECVKIPDTTEHCAKTTILLHFVLLEGVNLKNIKN